MLSRLSPPRVGCARHLKGGLKTKNPWDLDGFTYNQWDWNDNWRIELLDMLTEVCFSRTTDSANASEVWFDSWVKFASAKKNNSWVYMLRSCWFAAWFTRYTWYGLGSYTLVYVCIYIYIWVYIHVHVWIVRKFVLLFPDRFRLFTRRGLRFGSTLSYF